MSNIFTVKSGHLFSYVWNIGYNSSSVDTFVFYRVGFFLSTVIIFYYCQAIWFTNHIHVQLSSMFILFNYYNVHTKYSKQRITYSTSKHAPLKIPYITVTDGVNITYYIESIKSLCLSNTWLFFVAPLLVKIILRFVHLGAKNELRYFARSCET